MLGLRTKEDKKFIGFFKLVQKEAERNGFVFFLDFGECNDIPFNDMIIDELFGWKIPAEKAEEFEKVFNSRENTLKWDKYCSWVIPKINNDNLIINFE